MTQDAITRLTSLPGVEDAIGAARDACTELRWHPALRRRTQEARAEATIRSARCSAAIDGARYPTDLVRDVARGAGRFPDDASGRLALGAVRVQSAAQDVEKDLGRAPAQVLARLHQAAAAGLVEDDALGRPRTLGERPQDGIGEPGDAPQGTALASRVAGIGDLLASGAPAMLVSALVHAEVLAARPFVAGNGVVARALARAVVIGRGLDPIGVVVPEAAHLDAGPAYGRALMAYTSGRPDAVAAWIVHCAEAVVAGAGEGRSVCDAVLAGRLTF